MTGIDESVEEGQILDRAETDSMPSHLSGVECTRPNGMGHVHYLETCRNPHCHTSSEEVVKVKVTEAVVVGSYDCGGMAVMV